MFVLALLLVSLLCFRAAGALGIEVFTTWQDSARCALAVMFTFTGVTHFTKMKEDFVRMVPKALPRPLALVYFTGICELLGAVGILLPQFRSLAGSCLIILLIVMFPANVNAARNKIPLRGKPPTPLRVRLPMQVLFIGLVWWSARV
jgi:uncharacterized membrane protein